jgi:TctA family transporter
MNDIVILIAGILLGIIMGSNFEQNKMRALAIQAGSAEYVCDKKTGKSIFTFISVTNSVTNSISE